MKTTLSNASYEQHLKDGLESLSKNFNIKVYRLAPKEDWPRFQRGIDLRIQIRWKKDCIWEFVVEKQFWHQRNTNKEDRKYMRSWADKKIDICKNSLVKKKPKKEIKRKKKTNKQGVGHTQELFEKMKRK